MGAIGYQEFSHWTEGCFCLENIKNIIKRNTRSYAKRQLTFLKGLPQIRWYHPFDVEDLNREIHLFLNTPVKTP